jgi:hypothetical protein
MDDATDSRGPLRLSRGTASFRRELGVGICRVGRPAAVAGKVCLPSAVLLRSSLDRVEQSCHERGVS